MHPAIAVILMIQSDLSSYSRASASNTKLFIAQMVFVGVTAFGTLLFAWLLFRSGNNVQDAIRDEARADVERIRNEANVEIERIKSDAAKSKQESDEKIAGLTAQAEGLRLDLSKQQEQTALAEKNLLELRERINDRTITPDQRTALLIALTAAAPKCPIRISVPGNDAEALRFAQLLRPVLVNSGWEVGRIAVVGNMGNAPIGIRFSQREPGQPTPCIQAISAAFNRAGITPLLGADPRIESGVLDMTIGRKQ